MEYTPGELKNNTGDQNAIGKAKPLALGSGHIRVDSSAKRELQAKQCNQTKGEDEIT